MKTIEENDEIPLTEKNKRIIKKSLKNLGYIIESQKCYKWANNGIKYICMLRFLTQQEREQKIAEQEAQANLKPTINAKDIEIITKIVYDVVTKVVSEKISESEARLRNEFNQQFTIINDRLDKIEKKLDLHHQLMIEHNWIKE